MSEYRCGCGKFVAVGSNRGILNAAVEHRKTCKLKKEQK